MDANFSTMTMPKTMPVQNLLRYISFKSKHIVYAEFCENKTGFVDSGLGVWSDEQVTDYD